MLSAFCHLSKRLTCEAAPPLSKNLAPLAQDDRKRENGTSLLFHFQNSTFYILNFTFAKDLFACAAHMCPPLGAGRKKTKIQKRHQKKSPCGSFFISAISSTASFATGLFCLSAGTPSLLPRIPRPRRGFAGTLAEKAPKGPGSSPAHRQRGATCARLVGSSRARAARTGRVPLPRARVRKSAAPPAASRGRRPRRRCCTISVLSCVGLLHRATHSLRSAYIASAKTTFWNSACSASAAAVSPASMVRMLVYCTSACSARFLWAQSENSAESMFGRWASALACGFIACCCAGVRSYPIRRRKAGSSRHSRGSLDRAWR